MPFLAVAAIAGGAAVATGVVAASTMAMVGLGATVVGHLTKSKELMQIGAGLSLGTSVVGLAQSAFGGATAAEGLGSAATGSGDAVLDSWAAEQGVAEAASGADALGGASSLGDMSSGATEGLAGSKATGVLGASKATTGFGAPVRQFGEAAAESSMMGEIGAAIEKVGAIAPPEYTDPGSISKWWSNLSEPVKNKILTMGEKAAGSLFNGWTQDQKMAFEREKFNLEQQKYNTSVANANAQPTTIKPPAGGLLNARRA